MWHARIIVFFETFSPYETQLKDMLLFPMFGITLLFYIDTQLSFLVSREHKTLAEYFNN